MRSPKSQTTRNAIIWQRHQSGQSYAEIGAALNLSASRIRHICNRAAYENGIARPPERLCMLGDLNPQAKKVQNGH